MSEKHLVTNIILISLLAVSIVASAETEVVSYGKFLRMVHQQDTKGVVNLETVLNRKNIYAVGAIQHGLGEIVTIDGDTWLDYGADGIGNAVQKIPSNEQAVVLATAIVENWQSTSLKPSNSFEQIKASILKEASKLGVDIEKPFPFRLRGKFQQAIIHHYKWCQSRI